MFQYSEVYTKDSSVFQANYTPENAQINSCPQKRATSTYLIQGRPSWIHLGADRQGQLQLQTRQSWSCRSGSTRSRVFANRIGEAVRTKRTRICKYLLNWHAFLLINAHTSGGQIQQKGWADTELDVFAWICRSEIRQPDPILVGILAKDAVLSWDYRSWGDLHHE